MTCTYFLTFCSPPSYVPRFPGVVKKGKPNSISYGETPISALGLVLILINARGRHFNQFDFVSSVNLVRVVFNV